jgi:phosphoribosylformylglycinamidine synthase
MWQISEAIDGMAEACLALGLPVVGGNVSLYNQTGGRNIDPTPVVGVLGIVEALERRPPGARLVDGARLVVIGEEVDDLSGSRWAWSQGHRDGAPPALDLGRHRAVTDLVRSLVADGLLVGVHDAADGLGVAIAEMAARSGIGAVVEIEGAGHRWLFAESASRAVVAAVGGRADDVLRAAQAAEVPAQAIGTAGGDRLVLPGGVDLAVGDVVHAWRSIIPTAMATGATH